MARSNFKILSKFLIVIVIITMGIFFRFANLDLKPYWYDETYTSLQLSGYTHEEVRKDILTGRLIGIEDLQKYQYPNSDSGKTVTDTVNNIAKQEAQLTPLYFILARYWVQFWGHSVTTIRSLSAIFSLLAIPLFYWLCWQLFRSNLIASMGITLMAVSPFHILYAQESRPYSLWTMTILLSCCLFLKAKNSNSTKDWIFYTISLVIGLYSFLLSILVSISHGIYLIVYQNFHFNKVIKNYFLSTVASLVLFIPWIYLVITNVSVKERGFQDDNNSLIRYTIKWLRNIALFFVDFNIDDESGKSAIILFALLMLFILIIVAYSFYYLYINGNNGNHWFIFSLILVPAITLTSPDLIFGGLRAVIIRYMIPCFLGIQLSVAFLLGSKLYNHNNKYQKVWQIITVIIITLGIISGVKITFASTWWHKPIPERNQEIAKIVNSYQNPLIISDFWFPNLISLSYNLDAKVKFKLVEKENLDSLKIENNKFSNIFIYQASDDLKAKIKHENNYELTSLKEKNNLLFKIENHQD